jgi:hypothetical protein
MIRGGETAAESPRPYSKSHMGVVAVTPPSNSEENKDDAMDVTRLGLPAGYRFEFAHALGNYIHYSIAMVAATRLVKDRCAYISTSRTACVTTALNAQQECILDGVACTHHKDEKQMVVVTLRTNPDDGTFSVYIHSYTNAAAKEFVKAFRHECRTGNFYLGKHLQAGHPAGAGGPPLRFLPDIPVPEIYGFEKERASLDVHCVKYFGLKELHEQYPQRGILMHGRPGSGKSLITSSLKLECLKMGITVIEFNTQAMQHVLDWYNLIEQWLVPALVVMEDFDLVAISRERTEGSQVTTDLLSSLNGNRRRKGVIVTIATTNRKASLDEAILRSRRMDKIYEINGMQPAFQTVLFQKRLLGRGVPAEAINHAVKLITPQGTGADVDEICTSTLALHLAGGVDMKAAFEQSLQEWETAHKAKGGALGFARED